MISNECIYCNNKFRTSKEIQAPDLPNSKFQQETGPAHVVLHINHDPSLYIEIDFWDKLREARLAVACAPAINYCPWCGRKL